jgi:hypothetical protein
LVFFFMAEPIVQFAKSDATHNSWQLAASRYWRECTPFGNRVRRHRRQRDHTGGGSRVDSIRVAMGWVP